MKWVKIPTKEGNTLVPYDSIIAVEDDKDYTGAYANVFVKDLSLYTAHLDTSTRPELYTPINGIEVVRSTSTAEELLFLLNIGGD